MMYWLLRENLSIHCSGGGEWAIWTTHYRFKVELNED